MVELRDTARDGLARASSTATRTAFVELPAARRPTPADRPRDRGGVTASPNPAPKVSSRRTSPTCARRDASSGDLKPSRWLRVHLRSGPAEPREPDDQKLARALVRRGAASRPVPRRAPPRRRSRDGKSIAVCVHDGDDRVGGEGVRVSATLRQDALRTARRTCASRRPQGRPLDVAQRTRRAASRRATWASTPPQHGDRRRRPARQAQAVGRRRARRARWPDMSSANARRETSPRRRRRRCRRARRPPGPALRRRGAASSAPLGVHPRRAGRLRPRASARACGGTARAATRALAGASPRCRSTRGATRTDRERRPRSSSPPRRSRAPGSTERHSRSARPARRGKARSAPAARRRPVARHARTSASEDCAAIVARGSTTRRADGDRRAPDRVRRPEAPFRAQGSGAPGCGDAARTDVLAT